MVDKANVRDGWIALGGIYILFIPVLLDSTYINGYAIDLHWGTIAENFTLVSFLQRKVEGLSVFLLETRRDWIGCGKSIKQKQKILCYTVCIFRKVQCHFSVGISLSTSHNKRFLLEIQRWFETGNNSNESWPYTVDNLNEIKILCRINSSI